MTGWVAATGAWWCGFWFRDGSPYALAGARIVITLHALWLVLSRDLPGMASVPAEFLHNVPASREWRYLLWYGHPGVEQVLQGIVVVALVTACIGLVPRLGCLVAGIVLYHLAPLEMAFHGAAPDTRGFAVPILALCVLAMAPCGAAWSVRSSRPVRADQRWQFRWPVRLIELFIVQVYFFAGWAKLYWGGIDWISADNLRGWTLRNLQVDELVFTSAGEYIVNQPTLLFMAALGTVVLELSFPIVLFVRRARRVYVPLAIAFHIGVLFTMNFFYLGLPQLLVFVNWHWARDVFRTHVRGRPPSSIPVPT